MPTPRRRILLIAAVPVIAAAALATAEFTSAFAADDLPAAPSAAAPAVASPAAGSPSATTKPADGAGAPAAGVAPGAAGPGSSAPVAPKAAGSKPAGPAAGKAPAPLAVQELPNQAKAGWKPIGSPKSRDVAPSSSLNECAAVEGATGWQQQGWASAAKTPAIQDTFTFATPADADRARQALNTQLDGCQNALRDAQTKQGRTADATSARTATSPVAGAWQYQWTAVPGMSAPGAQTHHVYLAGNGNVLTVLQYSDLASAGQGNSATPASDAELLTTLAGSLALTR
ncbi:hypothetical protein [Streptomyces sp. NBC_00503]|uniref:hypothetical protein n=1 Tax=Streptomyces sp. NBC_00503 TaxID=2903659 RepID=UPI002E813DA7|nr:hypothetical protein [Streptomyces sp. NBC_00503]WUD82002.1 hypothetical protein OG490_16430 [Streptomyces sp. NBC_00503]